MTCYAIPGGHICFTEAETVKRYPDGERWCFKCRARRTFTRANHFPAPTSWHDPWTTIRCDTCNTVDGDLFPGRSREWE